MKKNYIAILILLVVVVVAIAYYFYQSNKSFTQPLTARLDSSLMQTTVVASKEFSCPNNSPVGVSASSTLTTFSVFDGLPSEMADLEPDVDSSGTSVWDVSGEGASKEGYYVICQYASGNAKQNIQFKLSPSFKECKVDGKNILCN